MSAELINLVSPEKREAAEQCLQTLQQRPPKLVQGMLLVGALISSLLVLWGSSTVFGWRVPEYVLGILFTALGWFLVHKNKNRTDFARVFCAQFGMMLGIIGRLELISWLVHLGGYKREWDIFVVAAVAAAGYPFFKAQLDRLFFCTWALGNATDFLIGRLWHMGRDVSFSGAELTGGLLCLVYFGFALWVFSSRRIRLRPLAYACLLACGYGVISLSSEFGMSFVRVLAAGLAAWCVSRLPLTFKNRTLVCELVVVLACWLNVPAFMGLFACAAGYYLRERYAEWLGMAGFAAGLVWMYYDMQATLLQKSGWLTLAGVCVFAAYAWVRGKYAR